MFEHGNQLRRLAWQKDKKPPEMSMYLSVLKRGGLHREVVAATRFIFPSKVMTLVEWHHHSRECMILPNSPRDDKVNLAESVPEL